MQTEGTAQYKHSKWMSFIDHRLKIAKDLLAEDGVVVVAIDENEHSNLVLMLKRMWPDRKVVSVAIQHNTKGIRGDDFRMNNDFAVFVYSPIRGGRMSPKQRKEIDDRGFMKYNLGDNQPNQVYPSLYPFIINPENGGITDIGDTPDAIPEERNVVLDDGNIEVWPFDSDGCTRTWSNGRATALQRVNEGVVYARNTGDHWDIRKVTSENPYFSLWAEKKYDNQIHGTNLLKKVFEKSPFPFPKSIATMTDIILATTRDRPEAKILDFFGGSGTTLHATMVVNEMYEGQRQCILVSAAEVNGKISIDDGEGDMRRVEHWDHLVSQGHTPTDDEWLRAGVIRSATLPRLDYFLRGVRHDGTDIKGDYLSGYNYNVNRVIEFLQIPQDTSPILVTTLVKKLTQERIGHKHPFYVSRNKTIAALWDADNAVSSDAFIRDIDNLPQNTKLERVFIRTDDKGLFANLQTQIQDALVNIPEVQENTRPMSLGFPNQAIECFQLIYGDRIDLLYNDDFTSMREISWLYAELSPQIIHTRCSSFS
jgi:adenine-specific DNA-methyltransferase